MVSDADDKQPARGVRGERHRLRGPSRIDAGKAQPARDGVASPRHIQPVHSVAAKKQVLFVCIGNSCRSQMAEAFARAYGADVMEVQSAGVHPATFIAPLTKHTLAARNLNIDWHFPKSVDLLRDHPFDMIVNMSGIPLEARAARMIEWSVPDPIGQSEAFYRTVATQIEGLVMRLILELRTTVPAERAD